MCRFTLWVEQVSTPLSHWTRGSWSWSLDGVWSCHPGSASQAGNASAAGSRSSPPPAPPRVLSTYAGRKVLPPPNGCPPFSTPPPPRQRHLPGPAAQASLNQCSCGPTPQLSLCAWGSAPRAQTAPGTAPVPPVPRATPPSGWPGGVLGGLWRKPGQAVRLIQV